MCLFWDSYPLPINTNHHSSEVVVVGMSYPALLTFHHNYFLKFQTWSQHNVNLGWSLSSLMRVNRCNSLFDGSCSPNISRMDKQRPFLLLGQIPLWVMQKNHDKHHVFLAQIRHCRWCQTRPKRSPSSGCCRPQREVAGSWPKSLCWWKVCSNSHGLEDHSIICIIYIHTGIHVYTDCIRIHCLQSIT